MQFINLAVYGLEESIIKSGYPMQTGTPSVLAPRVIRSSDDRNRSLKLAKTPSGSGHNNFLKGIIVQFDLQYPEYFSPQLQRYHWIDIVSSQSKMHRLTSKVLSKEDFTIGVFASTIQDLNGFITIHQTLPDCAEKKEVFQRIMTNLPSGYLKWMGISTNYLQLKTIYNQRKNHKLIEWREFCEFIETLPSSGLITNKEI